MMHVAISIIVLAGLHEVVFEFWGELYTAPPGYRLSYFRSGWNWINLIITCCVIVLVLIPERNSVAARCLAGFSSLFLIFHVIEPLPVISLVLAQFLRMIIAMIQDVIFTNVVVSGINDQETILNKKRSR